MSEQNADGGTENRLMRHGKLSYVQIPALDAEASAAFYSAVFGWSIRGNPSHRTFEDTVGEMIGAWITGRRVSSEPGVLPYIYVSGIDASIEKILANGGTIMREPYAEGDLWVATFTDPAGNVMGVWQVGPR